jgi:hypothetical protein
MHKSRSRYPPPDRAGLGTPRRGDLTSLHTLCPFRLTCLSCIIPASSKMRRRHGQQPSLLDTRLTTYSLALFHVSGYLAGVLFQV